MGLHINKVKGDYIFLAWEDGVIEKYKTKQQELTESGYELKSESDDYLNTYEHYVNKDGYQKTITVCCM